MAMRVPFSKYAGCGNDFILFDNRSGSLSEVIKGSVSELCHRQQGIGADGIIFLEESDQADFKMRIFNADGTEAEMCGNGIRCLMRFIHELNLAGPSCTIETMQRRLTLHLREDDNAVCVEMGNPTDIRWDVPLPPSHDGYKIELDTVTLQLLNTGVPHAILFVDEIDSFDLASWGPMMRYHPFFSPQGTNFNVATRPINGEMSIRTYERGVEGETLACGTGATAAALAAAHAMQHPSPIRVRTRSNEILEISFDFDDGLFSAVTMTGPAKRIYGGEVETS